MKEIRAPKNGVTVAQVKALEVRPILFCPKCQSEYAGDASDYWLLPDDRVFMCCNVPNKLMGKVIVYREMK